MAQRPQQSWDIWPGWSMITASDNVSFTLWFTGLHGTGKSTQANLVKDALAMRGYKVEIIDSNTLSYWLRRELHIDEEVQGDQSHIPGYDAFVTYLCAILARNGVITITTSISPYRESRHHAREHIQHFIEIYLHCTPQKRLARLRQKGCIDDHLYQIPENAELSIDTEMEAPERSALSVIVYLEQHGFIAPLWEDDTTTEEIAILRARLQPLGYLE